VTPAAVASRLDSAARAARGYGDATYSSSAALADPAAVVGADDVASAEALGAQFLALAEGMQELDVDAETLGDAMDMVDAEAVVADAAWRVRLAEGALADALEQLDAAMAMPVSEPCNGCHRAKAAAVAAAEDAVAAAGSALGRARARLREALSAAADIAWRMRAGLKRRHGNLAEAHADAQHPAERQFYGTGA
jgi:hypothetical protein